VTAQVSRPKPSDVSAVLAALLQYAAPDDMEPRLRQAVEMNPSSALARSLLGVVKAEANQSAAATALLFEAAADKSDWLVQYYVAQGLTRLARSSGEQRDPKVVAEAQAAVEAVLAARPQLAHALALKAYLQNDRDGVAAAARARALAPGREDYIYLEARLRAEAGEFAAARKLLAVLLRPGFPPNVRDSARRLTEQIVDAEDARAGRMSGSLATAAGATPPPAPADQPIAMLRVLKPGEQRTAGALEKVDCSPDGHVSFVVRSGGELKRFEAPALAEVEFIRYGSVRPEPIQCTDRTPPDHVYVTWVPMNAPGVTGRAVAMEFLSRK